MTEQQITKRQEREAIKFEAAKEIRRLLSEARTRHNKMGGDWDGDDLDAEVLEMVTDPE